MRNIYYLLGILVISVIAQACLTNAQMYEINYSGPFSTGVAGSPNLVVQTLKYAPYPVNAGDWFDVWVKVQNIGQVDAKNLRFELQPSYPFSSDESLIRDYGLIFGTISAYKVDQTYDSTQVILKYRVKVADSAPDGISNLKLKVTIDKDDPKQTGSAVDLPITIGKTKTDFDVVLQDSSTQGISFAISNIGENPATAVTVTLEPQDFGNFTGMRNMTGQRNFTQGNYSGRASANLTAPVGPISSIIGNLAGGDFTTVTFQTSLNSNMARIKIDYTDIAGIRNSVEKIVPVNLVQKSAATALTNGNGRKTSALPNYIYIVIGAVLGVLGFIVYNRISKKK